ncbi:MAG: exonuclease domain-containing protein [Flavobacteriaceae bacterium]
MEKEIIEMYAIVDVETTGGKYNEEGITEIAIYRFDGHQIVDQFSSLVNPLKEIQPFVQRLTGINSKMLKNAPKFFEIAKRIVEITEDAVLVAHNAEFDYRIIQTEFRRLGFDFERQSLCTVDLSQKLIPNAPSFKLGQLVRSLGIPISDVHRAHGDAIATVELFKVLLEKDSKKEIISTHIKLRQKKQIPSKYLTIIDDLPSETGVYYIYNKAGIIIYIGKSKNIKKRVLSHLTSSSRKAQKIQKSIHSVSFELSGNECLALLKEQHEIKKNQPRLNQALKFRHFAMGIRRDTTNPYHHLIIEQVRQENEYLDVFKNRKEAEGRLQFWLKEFDLCAAHTSLSRGKIPCFNYGIKGCKGACNGDEKCESYNERVDRVIQSLQYPYRDMLIIDKGKTTGEKSFIFIQEGIFQGYGYFKLNHQIKTKATIKKRLIPIEDNRDTQAVLRHFLRKERYQKLINLAEE